MNANLRRVIMAAGCLCIFGTAASHAITVRFDDANRGPSNTLSVGGVDIFGWQSERRGNGQLTTVSGAGLGIDAGVGPANEINRRTYFAPNQITGVNTIETGISLAMDSRISSITLIPRFRIFSDSGINLPDQLQFEMQVSGLWSTPHNPYVVLTPPYSDPITLSDTPSQFAPGSSLVHIDITSDWGEDHYFYQYRMAHLAEGLTFEYGVTIQSLQYVYVPEPRATALLSAGLLGFCFVRHKVCQRRR